MSDLPKSWSRCTVADMTVSVSIIDAAHAADRDISYIDISSIDNSKNRITEPKLLRLSSAPSRARQIVKSGDTLFATVRPYLRNIAKVPECLDGEIATTGFSVLRPAKGIEPGYLFYRAISRDFVAALTGEQYGVSYPAVKDEQVRAQPFELPPTNEQRRIVAKIEELFSELDKGVEALTTARQQLKAYRQAILKHAFEGKLTEDWRAGNPTSAQTSDQLLARLRRSREDVREVKNDELSNLPPLPSGYIYTYLSNLGDLARGKSKHRPRNDPRLFDGKYPFIQTGEVKAANRTIREFSQTYNEIGLAQSHLWPKGTLCITIAANIAETAFLGFDACFPDSVVGFTALPDIVLAEYVELFIKAVRVRIEAYAPATAQKNINLTTLENLIVPLCSLEEQRFLVNRIEEIQSVADANDSDIGDNLARSEALRQAVLKQAFSGLLVAQDPKDEPASALLERIRAEREDEAPRTRRNSKNGKKKVA